MTSFGYDRRPKSFRDFILKVGMPDSEFGRNIKIVARSSLEAGLIVLRDELIPDGYVAHSLSDVSLKGVVP